MKQIAEVIRQQSRERGTLQTSWQDSQQPTLQKSEAERVKDFLLAYNPSVQMNICGNAHDCFFGAYPTLESIKKAYGRNVPTMWLLPQLNNLSEFCGCRDKLQGGPLEECAFVIATEFGWLKVSELMLFFHRFKSGRYGRFYGSVDPLIITTSLRTFLGERADEIYSMQNKGDVEADTDEQPCSYEEYCSKYKQSSADNHDKQQR